MVEIPELRSEYIWVLALICFLIPAVRPFGAPFAMSSVTVEIYEIIDDLPEGSIVVMGGSGVFAFDLESSAGQIACTKQLASKGLRLVSFPLGTESAQLHKFIIDAARVDEKFGGPWKYGVDYVQLPYTPGGSAALVNFLEDAHSTVPLDIRGTPIDELPLMDDFHDYNDIAVWMCPHWGFVTIIRFCTAQYDLTSISFAQSAAYAFFSPYMAAYPGKVFMTNGYIGGAQYEQLVGIKGLGHKVVDSYSLISILIPALVVLGNVTMFFKMKEEEE